MAARPFAQNKMQQRLKRSFLHPFGSLPNLSLLPGDMRMHMSPAIVFLRVLLALFPSNVNSNC
jgi:hypothetical protein